MKIFFTIILIIAFIKSYYYGIYEIKEKENKSGGVAIICLAILGLILPALLLFLLY